MAGRNARAHHHRPRRAEASSPATSVAVAAARAGDAPRQRPRAPVQVREHAHPHPHQHQHQQLVCPQQEAQQQLRRSAAFPPRRQPHQRCGSERNIREHRTCAEVAGGTAAGCAAVCCCFPCVMVEVVVLATVRAPQALCRRAARVRRGRRRSASAGQASEIYELLVDDADDAAADDVAAVLPVAKAAPLEETAVDMEKEVWARFYGTGFWRSPSNLGEEKDR